MRGHLLLWVSHPEVWPLVLIPATVSHLSERDQGLDLEAWLEHWPAGPIVIVKSRCFHLGICFLDHKRAEELQRVMIPIIEALKAAEEDEGSS